MATAKSILSSCCFMRDCPAITAGCRVTGGLMDRKERCRRSSACIVRMNRLPLHLEFSLTVAVSVVGEWRIHVRRTVDASMIPIDDLPT